MSCENNKYTRIPPDLNFPLLTTRGNVDNNAYRWSSEEIQKQLYSTDILLISDDDAFIACYSHMKRVKRGYSIKLGMVDFGRFGDENDEYVKVALMRRSNGASDTHTAVTNAAGILCPKVALLVGICETMKPEKAKRGDVVISARLADVVSNTAIPVSRNMAKLILYAADGWNPPLKDTTNFEVDVHRQALMLSVPDVSKYCGRQLEDFKYIFPDAIVIEIGGIGRWKLPTSECMVLPSVYSTPERLQASQ
jgi:hypothetical protein